MHSQTNCLTRPVRRHRGPGTANTAVIYHTATPPPSDFEHPCILSRTHTTTCNLQHSPCELLFRLACSSCEEEAMPRSFAPQTVVSSIGRCKRRRRRHKQQRLPTSLRSLIDIFLSLHIRSDPKSTIHLAQSRLQCIFTSGTENHSMHK